MLSMTVTVLGWIALVALNAALALGFAVFLIALYVRDAPFFHAGRPHGDGELNFYDRVKLVGSARGRCIQTLRLRWWLGISSPRRAKWFIGFIRWEQPTP